MLGRLILLLTMALAVSTAGAQAPLEPRLRLRECGRTTAIGGPALLCCFGADTMVTLGDRGDLIWWDTGSLRVLQRMESVLPYVAAVAVHPQLPVLVVAGCDRGGRTEAVHSFDRRTGRWQQLASQRVTQLLFVEDGTRLLAGGGRQPTTRLAFTCVDGSFSRCEPSASDQLPEPPRARRSTETNSLVVRTHPSPHTWDRSAWVDSWVDCSWTRDDGMVVAADVQGQLHVLGPAPEQERVVSAHRTEATRLVWSSDSRHLAVQGMGALRIVDLGGRVVIDLGSTKAVTHSDTAPEFVIADKGGFVRYHPASGRFVGLPVPWQVGRPDLLGMTSGSVRGRESWESGHSLYGSMPLLPLGSGLVFAGDWRAGVVTRSPWIGPDGACHRLSRTARTEDVVFGFDCSAAVRDIRRDRVWFGQRPGSSSCMGGFEGARLGNVRVLDAKGSEIELLTYEPAVGWMAMTSDAQRVLVGLDDGTVVDIDADSLAERGRSKATSSVPWLAVLDQNHGIAVATGGRQLLLVALPKGDQPLRELATIDLPAGMPPVDLAQLAPDRVHLALASDDDVRLVEITGATSR